MRFQIVLALEVAYRQHEELLKRPPTHAVRRVDQLDRGAERHRHGRRGRRMDDGTGMVVEDRMVLALAEIAKQ